MTLPVLLCQMLVLGKKFIDFKNTKFILFVTANTSQLVKIISYYIFSSGGVLTGLTKRVVELERHI